jgi:hypothetical protein
MEAEARAEIAAEFRSYASLAKHAGRWLWRWLLAFIWVISAYAWQFTHLPTIGAAATWTQQTAAGSRSWRGVASSADGNKVVAAVWNGYVYTADMGYPSASGGNFLMGMEF